MSNVFHTKTPLYSDEIKEAVLLHVRWSHSGKHLFAPGSSVEGRVNHVYEFDFGEELKLKEKNRIDKYLSPYSSYLHGKITSPNPRDASWSPNDRYIAFPYSKAILIVDVRNGNVAAFPSHNELYDLYWSTDDYIVVTGIDFIASYKFYERDTLAELWKHEGSELRFLIEKHKKNTYDEASLYSVRAHKGRIVASGKFVHRGRDRIFLSIFDEGGSFVNLYDPDELKIDTYSVPSVSDIAFSPSGEFLALAIYDMNNGDFVHSVHVYKLSGDSRSIKKIAKIDGSCFVWLDEHHLAVAEYPEYKGILNIYRLTNSGISEKVAARLEARIIFSMDYNPSYGLLAVAIDTFSGPGLNIFRVVRKTGADVGFFSEIYSSLQADVLKFIGIRIPSFTEIPAPSSWFQARIEEDFVVSNFSGSWSCVKLGCGGWGCAYLCRRGDEQAVFKVPRGLESIIEGGLVATVPRWLVEKIIGEAEVVSALNHPHVLRLLGYSKVVPLLVYEYADGGMLEDQLIRGWRPSVRDAMLIGVQLGDVVRYVHSRGLVHGDIKPSNVFVANGVVKLGDFSTLTKLLARTSRHSSLAVCTPGWCAPEQVYSDIRRRAVEAGFENRRDIYQLGNLLLWLLTGESIDGEERIANEREYREKLGLVESDEARTVVDSMLKIDPWERPSADEVVKKLASIYKKL